MTTIQWSSLTLEQQDQFITEMVEIDKQREWLEQFDWEYERWRKEQNADN